MSSNCPNLSTLDQPSYRTNSKMARAASISNNTLLRSLTGLAVLAFQFASANAQLEVEAAPSGAENPNAAEVALHPQASTGEVKDPWEGFNRKMFTVHTFLDDNLLVPAALGYRAVTPKTGRRGIRRFLANLRAPGIFINDLLQGEFGRAGETLSRFAINSTIGAGGFADPAAQLGIPQHGEDFGQTLATWGVPPGPFIVLPMLGPTTLRDLGAIGPQIAMNPMLYVQTDAANLAQYSMTGVGALSAREPFIEPLQDIRNNSLDYYSSFKSFYLQARKREIANGRTDFSDLPDIGSFDDFDELE